MVWKIVFTRKAEKEFSKLDRQTQKSINRYLDNILEVDDPYRFGKSLTGKLSGFWRYRVGKYRIICDIQDQELIVELITIAKRDKVYM